MRQMAAAIILTIALATTTAGEVVQFTDSISNSFLASWTVWMNGKELGITDTQGRFPIKDATGEITLTLKHPGAADKTVTVTIKGTPGLMPVTVP